MKLLSTPKSFQKEFRRLIALLSVSVAVCAQTPTPPGNLESKTTAYFVHLYGSPKSSKTVSAHSFVHEKRGSVPVKGQFSVREFRSGDLIIEPVFFLPSLKLAAVRLQLPRQWTVEQVNAALAAYGSAWAPIYRTGIVDAWVSPTGEKAISLLTMLEIQSPTIVEAVAESLAEAEAKRKAVPKF